MPQKKKGRPTKKELAAKAAAEVKANAEEATSAPPAKPVSGADGAAEDEPPAEGPSETKKRTSSRPKHTTSSKAAAKKTNKKPGTNGTRASSGGTRKSTKSGVKGTKPSPKSASKGPVTPPRKSIKSNSKKLPMTPPTFLSKGIKSDQQTSQLTVHMLSGDACFIYGHLSKKEDKAIYIRNLKDPLINQEQSFNNLCVDMLCFLTDFGTNNYIMGEPNASGTSYNIDCFLRVFREGSDPVKARQWGKAFAEKYKETSKFNTRPKVVVKDCRDLPVNYYLHDDDAAKLCGIAYQDAILSGTFWDHPDVVSDWFGDLENPEDLDFDIELDFVKIKEEPTVDAMQESDEDYETDGDGDEVEDVEECDSDVYYSDGEDN